MLPDDTVNYGQVALIFTRLLSNREYEKAYSMTAQAYREGASVDQLRIAFEEIVPSDWGPTEPIEVVQSMTEWPGKQVSDLAWAYVSIYGEMYGEAVTVVVALEEGEPRIRDIEFGRP